MVKCTLRLFFPAKKKYTFIDAVRLYVCGGTGGNGLPRYGGMGGKGGDVYVEAKKNIDMKQVVQKFPSKRIVGSVGENSRSYRILGNPGEDVVISCPLGVTVVADSGKILGDLNNPGDQVLVSRGGKGGGPDSNYFGQKGETNMITLDLKLIADVGLVGFPNAGKSTLLKALSRASPKIANYPFTTIQPNIGIVNYEDFRQISVADLPGLIEGAHVNFGMGHRFLKHVVRTKLLLFVVDITGFQLSYNYHFRNAFETVMLLNKELELYKEDLVNKPALLAVNKMDKDKEEKEFQKLLEQINEAKNDITSIPEDIRPATLVEFDDIIPICANKAFNIPELKARIRELIDFHYDVKFVAKTLNTQLMRQPERKKRDDDLILM